MAMALPGLGATTYPAGTNVANTFFQSNVFRGTVTFGTSFTNALTDGGSKINGVGFTNKVVTGDGSGLTDVTASSLTNTVDGSIIYSDGAGNMYILPNNHELEIDANVRMLGGGAFYGDGSGLTNLTAHFATNASDGFLIASTNYVGANYLKLVGGTVSGAVTSTSTTTNSPSSTELATAGWVRSLFNNGVLDYVTTNIDTAATNAGTAGQPVYKFATTIPASASRSYVNPAAGTYVGSVMTTNTFQFLQGPVEVNGYFQFPSGGGNAITLHPEIYYSYDKTNWQGDYEASGQALVAGNTNLYQWVVSFPAITSTNSTGFYLQRRYKIDSKGGSPTLTVLIGTNIASGTANAGHISFSGPNSGNGNAYLANDQTFTGTNTFTKPINATTINASTFNVGTLTLTNPPTLDLSASTNLPGSGVTSAVTNAINATNLYGLVHYSTNLSTMAPDFNKVYSTITTNAAFTFLAPLNVSATLAQTAVILVTNSTAAAVVVTPPANVHSQGTWNVTNVTTFTFFNYPGMLTNAISFPLF